MTSLELARSLLSSCQGNLLNLYELTYEDLLEQKGIGPVKAIQLKAVAELSRRIARTNRGYQGGYRLAKNANEYTIGDILRLTEGGLAPVACLETTPMQCDRADSCATLPVWKGLYDVVNKYLDSITLQDIVDNDVSTQNFGYVI